MTEAITPEMLADLSARAMRVAIEGEVPDDDQSIIADMVGALGDQAAIIRSQQTEIERLRDALKPFSREAERRQEIFGPERDNHSVGTNTLTVGHLRQARAALTPTGEA